jgi:hypothetical protein
MWHHRRFVLRSGGDRFDGLHHWIVLRPEGDTHYHCRRFYLEPALIDYHRRSVQTDGDRAFGMDRFVVVIVLKILENMSAYDML